MKKGYVLLSLCVLFSCITVCFSCDNIAHDSFNKTQVHQNKNREIIESGEFYRIYKEDGTRVSYVICNSKGEVVLSETTTKPVVIDMISSDIVDIGIGMGTGLTIHRYYSAGRDLISEEFSYVLSNINELVAYIDVPKEKTFENRKIIVRNVFDKDLLYKEFQLDFSSVDTPVIQARFLNDGALLQVTYLSGEEQTQISKTLKLKSERGQEDGSVVSSGTVGIDPK